MGYSNRRTAVLGSLASTVVLVLTSLLAAPIAAQQWRELGPSPLVNSTLNAGRFSSLALSRRDEGLIFAGAASGGVWVSRNDGGTWRPLGDGLPIPAIGALALDPQNEDLIYAGSGEANHAYHSLYGLGLYKSANGGRNWQVLAADTFAGRTFSELAISPANGNLLWAAVNTAGGTSEGTEGARLHPGRGGQTGLFRSTNAGRSWQRIRNGLPALPASDVDLDPANPGRIFVSFGEVFGDSRNGVYRSTDGGASFSRLLPELNGARVGRITLAISPSLPRRIYALMVQPTDRVFLGGFLPGGASSFGVYRSDDGGNTWRRFVPDNFMGQQGGYNAAIAVHPTDPDTVLVGGVQMLISRDRGRTWQTITPPHVDLHDIDFDLQGRLMVATDGGIFRSSDLGANWSSLNSNLGTSQIYAGLSVHPTDPQVMLAGLQDNGTLVRSGVGRQWDAVFGGDGGYTLIHPSDPDLWFVEFQGAANLWRLNLANASVNQSSNGISGNDRSCFLPPFVIDPADPERMLYATHRIYESTDRGLTWSAISGDLTSGAPFAVRALQIAPGDNTRVYAVTNDDRLMVSNDRGTTWTLRREGVFGWPRVMRQIAVDPQDADAAWVAVARFGGERILATNNGGVSWRTVGGGLPDAPFTTVAVHRASGGRVLLAGGDRGVFASSDDGVSWQPYGTGLPTAPVQDLLVDTVHDRLLVSTLGRGVWSTSLPGGGQPPDGGGCPANLGSGPFCALCGPCVAGEGDCDNDAECAVGLACFDNRGADFGFAPAVDVCLPSGGDSSCPLHPGHGRFCTECGPCGMGQGDCDRNSECAAGLSCIDNRGADFGFPPAVDVCLPPDGGGTTCGRPLGNGRYCTECGPCGEGEGDCDNDAECAIGLICVDNRGADFGFPPAVDVCLPP